MIPIFKPYMPESITDELNEILYSGNLAFGKYGKLFEDSLRKYVGNDKLLSTSSYNHALLIALSTLGLKAGDEIIASPVSCLASNQPFAVKGLDVVWADVEPFTGAMCVEDVKSKITKKTKAIFHNHYCGYLGYVNEINALAAEYGIPVVDDCIESFGSELNNKRTGNLGADISVFSFQTVRLPNTIDGGAIAFKNEELYEKAKVIRDYGIDRSKFRNELNEISADCDITVEGYGGLMSEVNSFIGVKQMENIDSLIAKQRENAESWERIISSIDGVKSINKINNTIPNYWVFGAIVDDKDKAIRSFRNKGYYATSVHINNNIYSVFKNKIELKGVNDFMKHFIALPSGWWINESDIYL